MASPGPAVARLLIYPVKSLDGQNVEAARVLASGALEHDRAYALFEADGRVVNAKRFPALQRLRTRLDAATAVLHAREETGRDERRFNLREGGSALAAWLGATLGMPDLAVREDRATGFPDDADSPGPTVISTATLAAIAGWFGLSVADARGRLRANVEVDGVPAFWEDRLFAADGEEVAFRIGGVAMRGVNPCLRCAVPARDPRTGAPDPGFAERFAAQRARELPPWAQRARFKPFYRAAVNTRAGANPGGAREAVIRVGDPVTLG